MNKLLVLLLVSCNFTVLHAGSPDGFVARTFTDSRGGELLYRELIPEGYDRAGKFPLVLFLHGGGERGDDNTRQLAHGSRMFTNPVNMEKYPAVVLFPQCPAGAYWAFHERPSNGFDPLTLPVDYEITPVLGFVMEMVREYVASGRIDTDRIYVVGLSMGGMATFDLACRFPDVFAAAVPICGAVNPERLPGAAGVNFRIFHGDEDDVVPPVNSRMAYSRLRECGIAVEYYELPGVGHGSWNPAFNFPDFFEWLFSQRKSR